MTNVNIELNLTSLRFDVGQLARVARINQSEEM